MEWTKASIMRWMHEHDIYSQRTPSERATLQELFIVEANKHQETAIERKLYRKGLKIIEANGDNIERATNAFQNCEV